MNKTRHIYFIISSFLGLLAVIIGAFGAHSIGENPLMTPKSLHAYHTGVEYQFYHALAIFICVVLLNQSESKWVKYAANCFIAGIVCFSGSIYFLSTRAITGIDFSFLGPVTPIGGLFFCLGWIFLIVEGYKRFSHPIMKL